MLTLWSINKEREEYSQTLDYLQGDFPSCYVDEIEVRDADSMNRTDKPQSMESEVASVNKVLAA